MMLRGDAVDIEALVFEPPVAAANGIVLVSGYNDTAQNLAEPAAAFAELGYLAVSISMRGFGASGGVDDCGIRQPDDVMALVKWVRGRLATPEGRVVLMGVSQGGQVVLLAAIRGAAVAAVAAWSPVTDVAAWRETTALPAIRDYIDAVCGDGDFTSRSPVALADRLTVPVLLIHDDADTRVPTEQSVRLHDALEANGRSSQLELLRGLAHEHVRAGNDRAFDLTASFFRHVLQTTA